MMQSMQTVPLTAARPRPAGKIISLADYRRPVQPDCTPWLADQLSALPKFPAAPARRTPRAAWLLDLCASLGVLVMTVSFTVYLLLS